MQTNIHSDSLKTKVAKGSMWVALEQAAIQGMGFVMGIVLARLLGPEAYGTIALVTIFIAIAQVIANSGMGQALVQKADSTEEDFNAVFSASMVVSVCLYVILFFAAPFIARFYHAPELTAVVRVLALNLFFFSLNSVQSAELYKRMRFDVSFRISVVISVTSALVGLGMALFGFGVWALVFSSVLSNAAGVAARMLYIDWHPRFRCDVGRLRPLFSFGWKLMASSLVGTVSSNLSGMLIGKFFSRTDLAYVNKGQSIPTLVGNNIRQTLLESTFPAMTKLVADRDRMAYALHRTLSVVLFVICPVMTLLGMVSCRLIPFLYGKAWTACISYAQVACAGGVVWTVVGVNSTVLMALGRSDWMLRISILTNVLSLVFLVAFLPCGVLPWMAANVILLSTISLVAHVMVVRRNLDFGFRSQFRDAVPALVLTLVMAAVVKVIGIIPTGDSFWAVFCMLAAQGVVAVLVYVSLAILLRVSPLREILLILEPRFPRRYRIVNAVLRRFGMRCEAAGGVRCH